MVVINDDKDKVSGKEILIIENCKFSILEFDNPNFHTVTSSINNLSKNKNLFLKPQSNLSFSIDLQNIRPINSEKTSSRFKLKNIVKAILYIKKEQVDVFFARNKYWDIIEFHKAVPIFELLPNSLKDKIQGLMVLVDLKMPQNMSFIFSNKNIDPQVFVTVFNMKDDDTIYICMLYTPLLSSIPKVIIVQIVNLISKKYIMSKLDRSVFHGSVWHACCIRIGSSFKSSIIGHHFNIHDDKVGICLYRYDLNEKKYFTSFLSNFKINLLYTKYPNPDIFRYIKVGEDLFAKKIRTVQIAKFISLYKEEYNQSDRGFISRKNEHIFIKQPNGLDGLDEHMSQSHFFVAVFNPELKA
ncbi:1166_t:CDS:2 [Gigaspora rosea]|nr:1166_t:CDS:2 [Gigaspora rosea]